MKQREVTVVTSPLLRTRVIAQAKKMVENNITQEVFTDEGKTFDGMNIFIDTKPGSTLFTFEFPAGFEKGKDKKIYVGNE